MMIRFNVVVCHPWEGNTRPPGGGSWALILRSPFFQAQAVSESLAALPAFGLRSLSCETLSWYAKALMTLPVTNIRFSNLPLETNACHECHNEAESDRKGGVDAPPGQVSFRLAY
jgi:hypothetical protein